MDYRNYDRGYAEPTMSASDYMTRTYRWMASGLLITFAMAYITATTPLLYLVDSLYLVLTIAELALVFVLSSRVQTMSVQGARATFFGYALLNGMVLSYYFLAFSVGTLILAFLSTALYTTGCTCHVIFCRICQYFQFFLYCKIFLYDQLLITIRTFVCFLILSHGSEKCNGKIEHLFLLLGKNIAAQKSFPVLPYKVLRSMND